MRAILERDLPGGRLLAAGCGPRENLDWLRAHGDVVGLELERAFGARGQTPFVLGRLEAIPFASARFDAALALDVLEHLDDDAGAVRELARVVRPGGLLLVTVPAHQWLWSSHDEVNEHRRRYDARGLRAVLEAAGLEVQRLTFFNTLLFPPIAAARLLRRLWPAPAHVSDFEGMGEATALNGALGRVFALERHLVSRVALPVGVSLLAVARR